MAGAAAAQRFSIREYAAKMRSVDSSKCWPFGGEISSLPPISVKEFRFWSDEVRTARDLDGEDAVDGSEAEVMVDEGGDGMRTKVSGRGKQRTPKKRSIVELFAVAPPVEAVEDDGEDSAATEEGSDSGGGDEGETAKDLYCAVVRRKVIKRAKEERKGSGRNKNLKKEKGRKKKTKKILAGKTEKVRNSKLSSLVNISHILQDLVHKKWFGMTSRKPVDRQRKNPVVAKCLKKKSKGKLVQPSKMISFKQGEAKLLPVPSILKKRIKGNSGKKGGISVTHRRNLMKLRCESRKHVSFSGKDAIHAHNESCSPMEFSQLQNLCKIVSHVLAASSAMDNSSEEDKIADVAKGNLVVDVNDKGVARSVMVRENEALPEKKQLSCSHADIIPSKLCSPSKTNCADREKSIAETLDLNATLTDSDLICLNPGTSSSLPTLLYSGESNVMKNNRKDDLKHGSENHVEECYPGATSLFGPTRKRVSGSVSSLAISNTPSSQNSVSCVVRTMEGSRGHFQQSVDPNMDLLSHVPEFQAKYHLSPKDVISICSSAGSKRSGESSLTSEPGSTSKDRYKFEDFIGLPLNSQGELIQLHSGAKFGFNEMYKRQNTAPDPIQNLSIPSYVDHRSIVDHLKMKSKFPISALNREDKSYWFPDPYYPASDLLGFRDLQECERSAIPKNSSIRYKGQFTCPEHNPMTDHCHGCQKGCQFHSGIDRMEFQSAGHINCEFQPASQPTVRLMGKDVTVGRSNQEHHGFDAGKTWTGKVTMAENCPSVRITNNSLGKEWPQEELVTPFTCGTSKGNSLQLSGAQSCSYHMPPTLPRSGPPYFDCQPQWMSTNRVLSTTEKYSSKENLFRHPVPVQVVLNETPRTFFNSISGDESLKMAHQMPMVASKPQNVCQHMLMSSTHCKHSPGFSYSRPSTFHSLFPNQGHIIQPSMAPSRQDLPHWMLNAKHHTNQQPCPPYSSQFAVHHASGMLGADHFPLISPCPTSMFPLPVYSADAPVGCGSSMSPASIAPPPLIPSLSANKLSSKFNYKCRDKCKNVSGEKSKWTYLKGVEGTDQSRKRLAANDNEFMKPTKKSCLAIQDDLNAATCPRRGDQFHGHTQQNRALPGSQANIRSETDTRIPGLTDGKDESGCAYGPSSKYNERPRFGPTKLTAGAKHILKPSSSVDQDGPRSIHSTVPFSTGTNSDNLLVLPKKATKIYRF